MEDTSSQLSFLDKIKKRLSGRFVPENTADLRDFLKKAHEQEVFDSDTLQRFENLIKFNEMSVRDAMISRAQMDVIKTTDSFERVVAYAIETAHSRFPVIADDKDHVVGILHAKDLLKCALNPEYFKAEQLVRSAVFVPESKSLSIMLKEFQEQHNHMAIVVDEYGGISGLITFEDLIEEILGKIEDEFDNHEQIQNITPVSTERWRIHARTEITDINQYFGTNFSNEEADTIGGLLIEELGHVPVRGEKVRLGQWLFTVARADNRRVHTLMMTRLRDETEAHSVD